MAGTTPISQSLQTSSTPPPLQVNIAASLESSLVNEVDSIGSHPEAPKSATNNKDCFIVRCLVGIKNQIVRFFNWMCSCFYARSTNEDEVQQPTTKEQIQSVTKEEAPQSVTREQIQSVVTVIDYTRVYVKKNLLQRLIPHMKDKPAPLIVTAAFIEGYTLLTQVNSIRTEIIGAIDKPETITISKLQADKQRSLELLAQCKRLKTAEKTTSDLEKIVEDFSLEKVQFSKDFSSIESIRSVLKDLSQIDKSYPTYYDTVLATVNGIRQKNGMEPI